MYIQLNGECLGSEHVDTQSDILNDRVVKAAEHNMRFLLRAHRVCLWRRQSPCIAHVQGMRMGKRRLRLIINIH